MRRKLRKRNIKAFIFLFLTVVPAILISQIFFEGTPFWEYHFECFTLEGTFTGTNRIEYIKDTLIDDIEMKLFFEEKKHVSADPFFDSLDTLIKVCFYEIDDKVWSYNLLNNTSSLIYGFSLEMGDTLMILPFDDNSCFDLVYYHIDSIGYINIDGHNLKFQDVILETDNTWFDGKSIRIIQKIGAIGSFFGLDVNYNCITVDCSVSAIGTCYKNVELNIVHPSNNCGILNNTVRVEYEDLNIFPNPIHDYFKVHNFDNIEIIKILNISGEQIKSFSVNGNIVNISAPPGIYFIHLIDENNVNLIGKIIKI